MDRRVARRIWCLLILSHDVEPTHFRAQPTRTGPISSFYLAPLQPLLVKVEALDLSSSCHKSECT